jgi:hypothetical protein
MTDQGSTRDDHLDDEALADLVDGAAPEAAGDHVAECERCAARLGELVAAAAAVAAPVAPLPDDVKEAQLRAALAAFAKPADAAAPTRPLPTVTRRQLPTPLLVAASIVVVLLLGFGAFKVLSRMSSSAPSSASGETTTSLPQASLSVPPVGQLRQVLGPASTCAAVPSPAHQPSLQVPDVVAEPATHPTCVTLGGLLVDVHEGVVSGPPDLRGSDTITLQFPADAMASWPTSPPAGPTIALLADGAAVGLVHSITVTSTTATVVVTGVPPAVARYLSGLLAPA